METKTVIFMCVKEKMKIEETLENTAGVTCQGRLIRLEDIYGSGLKPGSIDQRDSKRASRLSKVRKKILC